MAFEGQKVRRIIVEETDSIATIEKSVERSDTVVCRDGIPIGVVADVMIEADRLTDLVVDVAGRMVRVPIGAAVRASNGRVDLMLEQADIELLSTATVCHLANGDR